MSKMPARKKIAIVGASGNAGSTLLRLLLEANQVEVALVTSASLSGEPISEHFPDIVSPLRFSPLETAPLNQMDLVFVALPHGMAKPVVAEVRTKVIDLSADHRLSAVYGLPELFSEQVKEARLVANPGCYATACLLSAYPIRDMVERVVFTGISGYSGGGKQAKQKYDYDNNIVAYALTDHFHKAEITHHLGMPVTFTPHVVDIERGLLVTAHLFLRTAIVRAEILSRYAAFYKNTRTQVVSHIPSAREAVNSEYCLLGGFELDERNGLTVVAAIDNLMKGAASQAQENMQLMLGLK